MIDRESFYGINDRAGTGTWNPKTAGEITEMVKQQVRIIRRIITARTDQGDPQKLGEDDAESEADKFERKLEKLKHRQRLRKRSKRRLDAIKGSAQQFRECSDPRLSGDTSCNAVEESQSG